jgi:hypothetical protein
MPLTKNLYREDEVIASLKFCVLKGKAQEAVFWAQEALDSDMRDDVLESLLWVWVLAAATAKPWWLATFRETLQRGASAITDEEVQYLVMSLSLVKNSYTCREGSALTLLGLGLRQEVWCQERVGLPTLPVFSGTLNDRDVTVVRALKQRKVAFAWGLLIPAWGSGSARVWEILKTCAGPHGAELIHMLSGMPGWFERTAGRRWVWPLRAAAVAIAAWPPGERPTTPFEPPIEWVAFRYQWLTNPMRYRRIYSPQPLALFWHTERGQLGTAQSTESELMEHLESAMGGSAYWGPRVPELSASDTSREDFYDKYFPNDIPDEWMSAERQVSHGRGVVSDPENVDWSLKYETALNTWFGALNCHMWQGIAGSLKGIFAATQFDPKTHRAGELFTTIADAYDALEDPPAVEERFPPVKREFVVV